MTSFHSVRVLTRPRYRLNWIRGRYRTDGFEWYVRGTDFSARHENWLRSMVEHFDGELFVDVGAHIGTWTIRAARSFRQVVAFEPTMKTNRILRTTIRMNKLANISVYATALSNRNNEGSSSIIDGPLGKTGDPPIPVRTLDSFKLRPSLIKIDTEGDEYPVLQGSMATLERRPRIVVETHSLGSLRKVKDLLDSSGYSIKEIRRRNRFNQLQSWLLCN